MFPPGFSCIFFSTWTGKQRICTDESADFAIISIFLGNVLKKSIFFTPSMFCLTYEQVDAIVTATKNIVAEETFFGTKHRRVLIT